MLQYELVSADHRALLTATIAAMDGEDRDGQLTLTDAVADALDRGHHLIAEAPTGSGKSLAYLAPAVASGRRVVVATSTIALQSQLVGRDLPALREHGGMPFTFALLKGRANYLCLAKLRAAGSADALFEQPVGRDFGRHLERLRTFADRSDTGDRGDIDDPIADASWAAVSCTSLECPGRVKCSDGDSCFAELARDRARDAKILVVNHALYCTHLIAGGNVLPEHDAVVIDEAPRVRRQRDEHFRCRPRAGGARTARGDARQGRGRRHGGRRVRAIGQAARRGGLRP